MPIDTRDRRSSVVGLLKPYSLILPTPDASAEENPDRQQLAYSYSGIAASALYDIRPIVFTYAESKVEPVLKASTSLVPDVLVARKALRPALAGSAQMQQ